MSTEDFEKRLQRQPLRQIPSEWRAEILSAARQASLAQHAPRTTQHAHRPASLLSTIHHQLSTLLWPHPVAWAGLAAVWLVILGLGYAMREPAPRAEVRYAAPPSPEMRAMLQPQAQLLAELVGPLEKPQAQRPRPAAPQPRSQRREEFLTA